MEKRKNSTVVQRYPIRVGAVGAIRIWLCCVKMLIRIIKAAFNVGRRPRSI
jgi:hypothetical protein